jgi:hypothetical protein
MVVWVELGPHPLEMQMLYVNGGRTLDAGEKVIPYATLRGIPVGRNYWESLVSMFLVVYKFRTVGVSITILFAISTDRLGNLNWNRTNAEEWEDREGREGVGVTDRVQNPEDNRVGTLQIIFVFGICEPGCTQLLFGLLVCLLLLAVCVD